MTSSGNEILSRSDIYEKTIFSPRWYVENMLWIVDKNGKMVRFALNEEQSKMMEHVEFCLANNVAIRIIVLKARQIGATTFFAALGFWLSAMNKNTTYGIVAHRLDSAESIFQKCKIFYNNLPGEMKPNTTQMSSEGITFDKKDGKGINSKIRFATVNEGVFRGQTLTYLHLTECAFWEGNVAAIENSLAPTIGNAPHTIIVRESTANGYNTFKDDWDRAVSGRSSYKPFFFGWQDHKEYTIEPPRGFELTEEEERLKERFELTNGQVYWRRRQIDDNYSGNDMWFRQENPMTAQEAFVASGSGVFDNDTIIAGYEAVSEPKKVKLKTFNTFEKLLVWEEPQIKHEKVYAKKSQWSYEKQEYEYIDTDLVVEELTYKIPYTIGVDTSGMGADYNQVVVVNNVTKEVVARYGKRNIAEENLAKIVVEIAKMYNDALIVPEVNYSHEICNYIVKEGYKKLYITENIARRNAPVTTTIEYGFKTTSKTKAPIISLLRSRLNESPERIKDREFWYEAEYYLIEDIATNKMNAAPGHHDDVIMATAIAMYASDSFQASQTREVYREKQPEHFLTNMVKDSMRKKKTKLRKGVYRNNA